MTAWSELVATALIGTDRRPTGVDNAAVQVLDLAANWTPYRRAGITATTVDLPEPAPHETTPSVSAAAASRLAALLDGSALMDTTVRQAVLVEWLELAVAHGCRAPAHLLPLLLDYAKVRADLRRLIVRAGGARVHWLADQNPDWRTSRQSTVDSWGRGTQAQRVRHLRCLRHTDPAAARALLDGEWATLTSDERPDLVAALGEHLTPADEPLLERALDDRRKEVRDAAVDLLVRLPGSDYQARMAARARAFVGLGPAGHLHVSPPAECDPSMRRDGITARPPAGTGARAWWLEEVLAHAPLVIWLEPAATFFARPVPDGWSSTVHRGLARAAAVQRDPLWASAALDTVGADARDRSVAASLYPVLEPDNLVRRTVSALTEEAAPHWGPMLGACPVPWPAELGQAVLVGIGTLARNPALAGDLHQLSRLAAVRMPPHLAPAVRELSERIRFELPDRVQPALGLSMLEDVLSFRDEMTQELQ